VPKSVTENAAVYQTGDVMLSMDMMSAVHPILIQPHFLGQRIMRVAGNLSRMVNGTLISTITHYFAE
jgi:hypothetical protein